ncbi:MAG: hypothetical protein ACM3XZ_05985 [Betaproteobacteria bacterium]
MVKAYRWCLVAVFTSLLAVLHAANALASGCSLWLAGEVAAVHPESESLRLKTPDGVERVVQLAPGAVVRRDGQPSTLWALRPVAPGFCHEVLVWLAPDGRARLVEGEYPGGEARVVTVGSERLTLELLDGRLTVRQLAPACRVSRAGNWFGVEVLQPGQWVYVLFDLSGRVKKIALPG